MNLTKHLYQFDEVVSSLQKSIRRGIIDQAIFWAGELCGTNDDFGFFLFKKLFTILVEDIGLASPELVLYTWPMFVQWSESTDRIQVDLVCIKFIKLLCLSKKNRLIANLLVYITKFQYPPNPDAIVNLDFNEFRERYPLVGDYILEMVRKEKKSTMDHLDIFSALVQFTHALATHDYDNAYFFAHTLNLANIEGNVCHQIVGHIVSKIKLSETNTNKASIIVWGIITNKRLLSELGYKVDKISMKIIRRLYLLTVYGLGNSNYNILFAICLLTRLTTSSLCMSDLNEIIEQIGNSLTVPHELGLFLNNQPGTIFQRRRFNIPEYALDLNTKRGRGINPKKGNRSTDYYLFNSVRTQTDCIVPDFDKWTKDEIAKSHGPYKESGTRGQTRRSMTHVQFMQQEGNYLFNHDDTIVDPYLKEAYQHQLDVEKDKNYTFTKYTKTVKFLLEDIIKDQIYWLVFPNFYIQSNPLSFNGTEIAETHLYEHEIFYDIVKIPDTEMYSAKMCYPEGYLPVSVIVCGFYGTPVTGVTDAPIDTSVLTNFNHVAKLKKDLGIPGQVRYHILKVYPTLQGIERECPYLIMETNGYFPLTNIVSYEHEVVMQYVLLLLFYAVLPTSWYNVGDNYAMYCDGRNVYCYGPDFADTTSFDFVDKFTHAHADEITRILNGWSDKLPVDNNLRSVLSRIATL